MPVIKIRNREISYDFEFKQKFLFIRGDSGIGKTSLIQLVADYNLNPDAVNCDGDTNIRVLISKNDLTEQGLIFFLDDNSPLLVESQSASLFNASDNYFVIITRSRKFNGFKTGLDSIVTMFPGADGTHTVEPTYPRKEHLNILGDRIVCEDAKSGKQFLEKVLRIQIDSAGSKDRFGIALRKLKTHYKESEFTIVYDRAGISFSYADQMDYLKSIGVKIISEIDWDSFESYILESDEYGVEVPWYPDKETNATRLFQQCISNNYTKSSIPEDMKLPVYWKVKEALVCMQRSDNKLTRVEF